MWITHIPMLTVFAVTLAGLVLLVKGLIGRIVYHDSLCRKCRYNLTGRVSPRCPECGSLVAEVGQITWRRQRRWRISLVGLLMLLPALTILWIGGPATRYLDGYHWKPTSWVFKDQQSDDNRLSYRAGEELKDRFLRGEMNQQQTQQLATLAIADLTATTPSQHPFIWSDGVSDLVLRNLLAGGHCSPTQLKAWFERMVQIEMSANPRALRQHGVPCDLRIKRSRWIPYGVRLTPFLMVANKKGQPPAFPPFPLPPGTLPCLHDFDPPQPLEPLTKQAHVTRSEAHERFALTTPHLGPIELNFIVFVDFTYQKPGTGTPTPLHRMMRHVTVRSDVLEAPAANMPELIKDPALADKMREAIQISVVRVAGSSQPVELKLVIVAVNPPTNGAMEVSLENGQDRRTISESVFRAGERTSLLQFQATFPQWAARNVTVVLRPKPEITYKTVDTIDRIWGEEMRFDVTLGGTKPATDTNRSE